MRYDSNASRSSSRPSARSGVSAAAIVLGLTLAMLLGARTASASDLLDLNATHVSLAVHGRTALVTYEARGATRHVLVWGASNALPPSSGKPQVRFRRDYSGGLHSRHRAAWIGFVDQCRAYSGPALAYFVTGCTAADGSYWAIQRWQRNLPHR